MTAERCTSVVWGLVWAVVAGARLRAFLEAPDLVSGELVTLNVVVAGLFVTR